MSIELRQLGPQALQYLETYLEPAPPMANVALTVIRSTPGIAFTFVPTEADDEVVHMLRSARGLHPPYRNIPLDEWTANMQDPSYTSVPSAKAPIVGLVVDELAREASSCLVCQNDVGFGAATTLGSATEASMGRWPTLLLDTPATRADVAAALNAAYIDGMFIGVVLTGPSASVGDLTTASEAELGSVADRVRLVLVEAYDGEGVLAWRPSGVARTSAST